MEYNDEESYRMNGPLKSSAFDCKKQKSQASQPLTIQPLRKTFLVDTLLKRIQPSLPERKWIIDQRQHQIEKPKVHGNRGRKERRRDISEDGIKKSSKANFDTNDKNKQRWKEWGEMAEREKGLMEKRKRKQNTVWYKNSKKVIKRKNEVYDSEYKEDNDHHSVHSSDSEVCLAGLTLSE